MRLDTTPNHRARAVDDSHDTQPRPGGYFTADFDTQLPASTYLMPLMFTFTFPSIASLSSPPQASGLRQLQPGTILHLLPVPSAPSHNGFT